MIVFDVIFILAFLALGYNFKKYFKIFGSYDNSILNKLFIFHIVVSVAFYRFVLSDGGDALIYWFLSDDFKFFDFGDVINLISNGSATGIILLLNYIPAKILNLSFFTGNIMYAVIGYMGFVYFYAFIRENIPSIYNLRITKIFGVAIFPFLFFLPNLHFWSSGIGKDTLLFFCIALFIYCLPKIRKRLFGIILSIILSLAIRPHIALFLLIAFGISYVIDGNFKGYQKAVILIIFLIGFVFLLRYVLLFVKLENFEMSTLDSFASTRTDSLSSNSGSGVDVSAYPYPLKVFTFLYRPLFFDSPSILGLVSSVENLILLIFSFKLLRNKPWRAFKKAKPMLKGVLVFFILGSLTFPLILGNLGIMLRQKTPFIMALLIFGYWAIIFNKSENEIRRSK